MLVPLFLLAIGFTPIIVVLYDLCSLYELFIHAEIYNYIYGIFT